MTTDAGPRPTIAIAGEPLTIEPGTPDDLRALAPYHYLGGPPATIETVLRARWCDLLGAVLVTSRPTLNARWRRLAWGDRYDTGDKRERARRLNAEVRCISRVIVDPRCRGVGIASALVRAYLARPATERTEAVAAMGRVCPFFASAGMTPWPLPDPPAHHRLRDALEARARRPHDLLDPERSRAIRRDPLLARELRTWARAQRHAPVRRAELEEIPPAAGAALLGRPTAYTHDSGSNAPARTINGTPARDPDADALPQPLTLFLSRRERADVRRALRALNPDPASALCRLLGIPRHTD